MLQEFAQLYEVKHKKVFPWLERNINCLVHVINLGMQQLIGTYSKSLHYNPHDPHGHKPDMSHKVDRDKIGLIKANVSLPTQLLIDMKVCWSSTYVMLNCTKLNKQHVDTFVYEMGHQECSLKKWAKINFLQLSAAEWTRVGQFTDLLSYADVAQQAFSSDRGLTLHLVIPALETLHKSWSLQAERPKSTLHELAAPLCVLSAAIPI
ncbi:uncharacterized protein F5891DRAFT_1181902 [Suillus fuscotomentosus]|uniref:Uncharacterized protein n=1 Tax=Suillus fuscotomentosus TaxID=1912939 RepID=A0AAD4EHT0_9AGAM|nr:uncharacterized protein F5891DRAFT_1181902 [Suillus fuscotomentosus]KAG1906490.1 hypothetical protein F5891DRAFT_1181902 [Suillus fuscotomentosus]